MARFQSTALEFMREKLPEGLSLIVKKGDLEIEIKSWKGGLSIRTWRWG